MKKIILWAAIIAMAFFYNIAQAKRAPAPEVRPIIYQGLRFVASGKIGYVEAWDMETNTKVWEKKVYTVIINPLMELDVQEVFITSMAVAGNRLVVINEKNKKYQVDIPLSILRREKSSAVNLEKEFKEYYSQLLKYRQSPKVKVSSITAVYNNCEAFKKIVKKGKLFIPFIIEEIKKGDFFLNQAMEEITGLDIASTAQNKAPLGEQEISKLWVGWWKKEQHSLNAQ